MRPRFIKKQRLLDEAHSLKGQANLLPYGPVRDAALQKAGQAERAAHLEEWAASPGLRAPTNTPGPN